MQAHCRGTRGCAHSRTQPHRSLQSQRTTAHLVFHVQHLLPVLRRQSCDLLVRQRHHLPQQRIHARSVCHAHTGARGGCSGRLRLHLHRLLLGGLRLRQIDGLRSLRQALTPALIKVVALPLITGCLLGLAGLSGDSRLALVLQAGMPTALGGLILAEEYDLDRNLIASSIVLTTLGLFLTIPLWLLLFGGRFNPQWLLSF